MVLFTFTVLYLLFMRKDAHYNLYRTFFIIGILATVFLPIIEIPYSVVVDQSLISNLYTEITPQDVTSTINSVSESKFDIEARDILTGLYLLGVFVFLMRLIIAMVHIGRLIRRGDSVFKDGQVYIINSDVEEPFTFYRWVLLPNDKYLEYDNKHVLVHENIHRYQLHWVDLFLAEALVVLQWFNPFTWMYRKILKQNLEFIADRGVLDQGYSLDKYIQSIICITMGAEVSVLANHFRYSPNKRRLKMMKNVRKSKWRQLKLLLMLPLLGGFLWAFSKPVYSLKVDKDQSQLNLPTQGEKVRITGYVVKKDKKGERMPGTSIVLRNKTVGTVADKNGEFVLEADKDDELVISFVGYKTVVRKANEGKELVVLMEPTSYSLDPSPYRKMYKGTTDVPKSLKNDMKERELLPPPPPPPPNEDDEPVFYVVESLPSYYGGWEYYYANLYAEIAKAKMKDDLKGVVDVQFTVTANGEMTNVGVVSKSAKKEKAIAEQIVNSLKEWTPGKQRGKAVDCTMVVPVEFE